MSKMQELYEKVSKDRMLQDKFASIMKEADAAGKEMVEEQLTAFAKEAGYDVTVEEMQSFFRKRSKTGCISCLERFFIYPASLQSAKQREAFDRFLHLACYRLPSPPSRTIVDPVKYRGLSRAK